MPTLSSAVEVVTPLILTKLAGLLSREDSEIQEEVLRAVKSLTNVVATPTILAGLYLILSHEDLSLRMLAASMLGNLRECGIRVLRSREGAWVALGVKELSCWTSQTT